MAESLNCVVYLLMKKPQELDGCPTSGAHFTTAIGGKPPPTLTVRQRLWRCCNNRLLKPAPANCFCATVSCSRLLNGPTNTRYHVASFTVPDSTVTAWPSRMICARTRSASACFGNEPACRKNLVTGAALVVATGGGGGGVIPASAAWARAVSILAASAGVTGVVGTCGVGRVFSGTASGGTITSDSGSSV